MRSATETAIALHAARLIETAAARGLLLAVAESLTGGMLASSLVAVPGASRAFSGEWLPTTPH